MTLIWFLLIGLLSGYLASLAMRGRGLGLIGDLVLGVVGAFLGGRLLASIGLFPAGLLGSLIAAFVGAVVLLFLIRLIKKA